MDIEREKEKEPNDVLFLRGVHPDKKAKFKAWCARRNYRMVDVINSFIDHVVENES